MKGRQGIVAGYNAQAMVSPVETAGGATGMLVTAVDVVDEANDNAMLAPMMEQAEETTGTKAQTTLADAGYFAGSHLEECASRGQQVVVSEARQRFLFTFSLKDLLVGQLLRQMGSSSVFSRFVLSLKVLYCPLHSVQQPSQPLGIVAPVQRCVGDHLRVCPPA